MMGLFAKEPFGHSCKRLPRKEKNGATRRCSCGAVYRFQTTTRKDKYGRPLKTPGAWILIKDGKYGRRS
jgi:hypothetical protein